MLCRLRNKAVGGARLIYQYYLIDDFDKYESKDWRRYHPTNSCLLAVRLEGRDVEKLWKCDVFIRLRTNGIVCDGCGQPLGKEPA